METRIKVFNDLCFVGVPEDAVDFAVIEVNHSLEQFLSFEVDLTYNDIKLPEGNWEYLGLSNELTEEQMELCVEKVEFPMLGKIAYRDYIATEPLGIVVSIPKSYASLLQKLEIKDGVFAVLKLITNDNTQR